MSKYNEILNELKTTLQKDDIESNIEQISLYDLFVIINSKFELLRSITQNDKLFTSKQLFHRKRYIPQHFYIDGNILSIEIYDSDWNYSFEICREIDRNDIFIRNNKYEEKYVIHFIKEYCDELNNVFNVLDIYSKQKELIPRINELSEIKYKYYMFNLDVLETGIVDLQINISISDEEEIEELYELLEESKFELSKKIMVDVKSLKEPIKTIVEQSFTNTTKIENCYSKINKLNA